MSINLQKGQKIDLTNRGGGLSRVMVGLGWDEAQPASQQSGGFFGLFKSQPQQQAQDIDCDASAILLNANGKLYSGAIQHQGDNLTGAGEGDDEQIMVDLNRVPTDVAKIVFVVNIYDANVRGQHFGMIQNAFIRLVNLANNSEICKFNLSENYYGMTGMIVGEIYRYNGEWKFNAIGQPVKEASRLQLLLNMYA